MIYVVIVDPPGAGVGRHAVVLTLVAVSGVSVREVGCGVADLGGNPDGSLLVSVGCRRPPFFDIDSLGRLLALMRFAFAWGGRVTF